MLSHSPLKSLLKRTNTHTHTPHTGTFEDKTVSQHKIRVAVRMFSSRIESGTDLLIRSAASNEALNLAYTRLSIVRLMRFSERRDNNKIVLSPTTLLRTRSQITCENRAKLFEPLANILFSLNKNVEAKEDIVPSSILRLLRLFTASQDEFTRMTTAPSYSKKNTVGERFGVIPSENDVMVTFVNSINRILAKDLIDILVKDATSSLMQSTRPGKSEMELEDVTCESLHPYWTRTNTRLDRTGGGERGQIELKTKGSYWILFDPRSATMGGNKAVLSFFSDLERRNIIAKCSGASPWAPIVVTLPTSTLYWSFSSNHPKSSKNDWGWKFQVLPLRGQSWSKEVEAVGCVPSLDWSCWTIEYLESNGNTITSKLVYVVVVCVFPRISNHVTEPKTPPCNTIPLTQTTDTMPFFPISRFPEHREKTESSHSFHDFFIPVKLTKKKRSDDTRV